MKRLTSVMARKIAPITASFFPLLWKILLLCCAIKDHCVRQHLP
jgi:hypothetical protein